MGSMVPPDAQQGPAAAEGAGWSRFLRPESELTTFRERLQWAMANCLPAGRTKPFGRDELVEMVARKVTSNGDPAPAELLAAYRISKSYLGDLLSGEKTNPSSDIVRTLGAFFGVGPAFFVGDSGDYARRIAAQVEYVTSVRNLQAYVLAQRAGELTEEGMQIWSQQLDLLLAIQRRGEGPSAAAGDKP